MLKLFPIFPNELYEKQEKLKLIKGIISNLDKQGRITNSIDTADIVLVISGDGGMTTTITNYHQYNKPFFGINCGTLGFLMNELTDINQIPQTFDDLSITNTKLIKTIFYNNSNGESKEFYAFNDVFCGGDIADFNTYEIRGSLTHFPNISVKGNGIFVSSTQGTTGYALNAKGSAAVLPLDSDTWYIGGVATGPYPAAVVKPQHINIRVKSRATVNAYADGKRKTLQGISEIDIFPTKKIVQICFQQNDDFESRRKSLALAISNGINIDSITSLKDLKNNK